MTDLEMTKLCAKTSGIKYRIWNQGTQDECLVQLDDGRSYKPLLDAAQAWALASRFPLIASSVFSAVAIARHDGETDPRMVDAKRLLVECVAKKKAQAK